MPEHVDRSTHGNADAAANAMSVDRLAHIAAWVMIAAGCVLMTGAVRAETRNVPAIDRASAVHLLDIRRQKSVALVFSHSLDHGGEQTALRRISDIIHDSHVGARPIGLLAAASLLLLVTFAVRRRQLSRAAFRRSRSPRTVHLVKT